MSVFETLPPALTVSEIEALVFKAYGIKGRARLLNSERDQNAKVDADGASYVLKIANADEDPAQIALQNATLQHLAGQGAQGVPHLIATPDGKTQVSATIEGRECVVRLVSWLDGPLLSATPRTIAQLASLGAFIGGVSRDLQGFAHPAAFRDGFIWSLDHVALLQDWADEISDPSHHALIQRLFDRYLTRVAPLLNGLRAQILHQDANDNNLITDPANPDSIIGLIDFGDMGYGRTVNELAITMAYALLDQPDLYAAMRALIAGYSSEFPLHESEAEVLYDLMRMRLVASVCISNRRAKEHPDNSYLLVSQAPAFALLHRLDQIDPEFMVALCRKSAGFAATRAEPSVRAQLASLPVQPLFRPELNRSARMAVLTDGTHPDMPAFSDARFDTWFTARRPENLPQQTAFYGLGPYGEKRSVYATDQFADSASPERRTRHLGIDVFAAAGTPVYAPLAGVVEFVTYNSDPLDYGNTLILRHSLPDGTVFFTLYGHLAGTLPNLLTAGQKVEPGQLIAHLGDWHENGGWSPHIHFQVMSDLLSQRDGNFFGVGHDSLWDVWSEICIDPNLILRLAPESYTVDPAPPSVLMDRRARSLGPSLSISYQEKLKIIRGKGAWLYDHTGRAFLDCVNNITHVGHCNPHVVQAISRQAAILNTNTRYLNELILDLSDRLTATLPGNLKVAYFVNSGTEANELALRIARTALARKSTVVLDWAYHGNSAGMVEISPYKFKRKGGFPQPDFVEVAEFPDPYRGTHQGMTLAAGHAYAADVSRCLANIRAKMGSGAAAFIAESISGVGGQVVYPPGYLAEVYRLIRAEGGLCIADEVQCGFGRVGKHFWGFELQSAIPDIVVMGKPFGNGHPLAAVVTTPELAARFANGMEYFNSFGGNPVSMAVGHAVMDVIENDRMQAQAKDTGDYMLASFAKLAGKHALIGDVRGEGLFSGIELVTDRNSRSPATEAAGAVVNHMRQLGVLASTDGPLDNVLKFKPPMVFGRAEADLLSEAIDLALSAV